MNLGVEWQARSSNWQQRGYWRRDSPIRSENRFVKTQDTVNCDIMVDPSTTWRPRARSPTGLCEWFGWKRSTIIDLG
jgi:hypothetical protein